MNSELERAILGVVFLFQPCSGYAVRMVFLKALSSGWKGSTGAIYPALKRLSGRGLIRSSVLEEDGRATRSYRLTAKGKADLVDWLRSPLPEATELLPTDPLRVRFRFLEVLTPGDRQRLIVEARSKLKLHIDKVAAEARKAKRANETYRYLSFRSALIAMRGQVAWLDEAEAMLGSSELDRS